MILFSILTWAGVRFTRSPVPALPYTKASASTNLPKRMAWSATDLTVSTFMGLRSSSLLALASSLSFSARLTRWPKASPSPPGCAPSSILACSSPPSSTAVFFFLFISKIAGCSSSPNSTRSLPCRTAPPLTFSAFLSKCVNAMPILMHALFQSPSGVTSLHLAMHLTTLNTHALACGQVTKARKSLMAASGSIPTFSTFLTVLLSLPPFFFTTLTLFW
mmetsp:Transcript_20055/g.41753  ORF Transcript_20055/g.41753 Transcript_20055/m.41753 type:complete len:219 (+) Transcript_20055:797-1453(+)